MMLRPGLLIASGIFAVDRVTKWLAVDVWDFATHPIQSGPFFNFILVWNTGVSFGMLQTNTELVQWILAAFAVAVSVALAIWLTRTNSRVLSVALGLVIGGALGNAPDRIIWGAVADFIDFHVGDWHWFVFNIADVAVVIGFGLIMMDGLFAGKSRSIKGHE
jgi:signal peptidase II